MACNLRYPTHIENSSIQNTRLIGYFTKVSMKLFELHMLDLVINVNADICEMYLCSSAWRTLHFIWNCRKSFYRLHIRMNHVCQPQEEKLGCYFQSEPCLGALESHVFLSCLLTVVCKWHVINVTQITMKIPTKRTRLKGYVPIVEMKLFKGYMFQLDININCKHLWDVLLLSRVTYVTFFWEIADSNLKHCILE